MCCHGNVPSWCVVWTKCKCSEFCPSVRKFRSQVFGGMLSKFGENLASQEITWNRYSPELLYHFQKTLPSISGLKLIQLTPSPIYAEPFASHIFPSTPPPPPAKAPHLFLFFSILDTFLACFTFLDFTIPILVSSPNIWTSSHFQRILSYLYITISSRVLISRQNHIQSNF
jgi:hypothetical protein